MKIDINVTVSKDQDTQFNDLARLAEDFAIPAKIGSIEYKKIARQGFQIQSSGQQTEDHYTINIAVEP